MADVEITVDADIASAQAKLTALDKQAGSIGSDGTGLDKIGSSAESASSGVGSLTAKLSIASAVGGLAASALSAAIGAITDNIGAAVARADTMNNFPKVMQSLGYSAEDASASIQKISDSLDGLPTSSADMASMTQQLAAMTGDLGLATDVALAFNNAMLAGGQGSTAATAAFTQFRQILAKGKPDMQDWNTLVSTAPAQMNQLAESLLGAGASADDLYTALGGGGAEATISMDELMNKLVELNETGGENITSFEEQARSATGGIGTAMENVQNRIAKAIEKIIEYFGTEAIAGAINNFSSGFSGIADGIIGALDAVKGAGIFDTFSQLGTQIGDIFGQIAEKVAPVVTQIGAALLPVANALLSVLSPALSVIWAILEPLVDLVANVLLVALQALQPFLDLIVAVLAQVQIWLTMLAAGIRQLIDDVGAALAPFIEPIVQWLQEDFPTMVEELLAFLLTLPQRILEFLTQILTNVVNFATQFATDATNAATEFFNGLVNGITGLPAAVASWLSGVISSAAKFVTDFATKATNAASDFVSKITSGLAGLPDKMLEIGANIVQGIADGISNAIGAVTDAIAGVADAAVSGLTGLLGIASPSRVMRDKVGKWIPLGVVEGIEESMPSLDATLAHMVNIDGVNSSADAAASAATPTYQFICDGATVNQTQEMQETFVSLLTDLIRRRDSLYSMT